MPYQPNKSRQPFSESEIQVFKEFHDKRTGDLSAKLRIVVYGNKYIGLEKRSYFINEQGEQRTGKAKMLNWEDLQVIHEHWDDIAKMFTNFQASA